MKSPLFQEGRYTHARQMPSQNCDARPSGQAIELVVLHNISLPPDEFRGEAVEQFFCNSLDFDAHPWFDQIQGLRVSSHFYLKRDGQLIQFVPVDMRAWHAGESCWRGRTACNDFSLGIELQGSDHEPFEAVQYQRLNQLLLDLYQAYPTLCDVAGHSDIAPGRKTDPGPHFDWDRVTRPEQAT